MKKCVVLTGAGISADSGLLTFRDAGGLWEGHRVTDVCTPEALARNPKLVIDFYNQRRLQANAAQPNAAHLALVKLAQYYDVHIITQNVDALHEKAGSSKVLHLHGELNKLRSTSMQVYPAASLIHYAPPDAERYLVDPNPQGVGANVEVIPKRAAEGVPALVEYLIGRV